jgi:hypothetical protein
VTRRGARRFAPFLVATAALAHTAGAAGQEACVVVRGTPFEALVSVRSLAAVAAARLLQPGSATLVWSGCPDSLAPTPTAPVALLPVFTQTSVRTAYPFDRNNGVLWSGKGFGQAVSAGARLRSGPLSLTVYPTVAFQQNDEFRLARSGFGDSPLRYPAMWIDWPQRLGETSFWSAHLGQTSATVATGPLEVAVGSESLWWGPVDRYPILLSSTGEGFLHARVGLAPLATRIGAFELGVVWGRLGESDFFDAETDNDDRLFTLLTAGYRPSFAPGLAVGAAFGRHTRWDGLGSAITGPFALGAEEDQGNGLLSTVADWRFPTVDLRVYGEWVREDHWLSFEDLVTELDHSEGFALGLEKLLGNAPRRWRVRWELVHLGESDTQSGRDQATFYTHYQIQQGHTQKGQLLGAAVGPGSNAQFLAVDMVSAARVFGGYLERVRRDDDLYEDRFARWYGMHGHDIELTAGLQGLEGVGPVTLQWDVGVSRRKNRSFIGLDGVNWDLLRETNLAVSLAAWWAPAPVP